MELTNMTFAERLNMMQKRHAFFEAMAENCSSFEEFIISYDERLAVLGIELSHQGNYLYLYMPLGFSDYEGYHMVHIQDSKLIVSPVISWQDGYSANGYLNIFTGKSVKEDEIFSSCITE